MLAICPQNDRSQIGFVFLHGGTTISWNSVKQILIATNHSKIITLYEESRECVWLQRVINHIHISCGIGALESPTITYKNNAACIAQMQIGYIKINYTKHISLKLFYPYELQEHGKLASCKQNLVIILWIYSQSRYLLLYLTNMSNALV
jgi:hypothetical protein